jgi:hypothetical protein
VRPVDPRTVDRLVRLSGGERARLLEQFATFRNRTRIEAGRMDAVSLQRETRDGQACWLHTGDWWQLESSADEEMTRRCVVRIEQMFRAYRQLFPPHREHATTLHIRLYGASDEYQAALQQENLGVENPALYLASRNTVLAGSDLNAYSRRLVQVREQNALTRRQYTQLNAAFPSRMAALGDDLRRKGYTAEEVVQETKLHTATWKREYEAALARIHRAEQQNHARFAEVTALMFQRLYHEAFHAYLENHVLPSERYCVPRWLSEGLAQIFETGQLDGDTLRVDAPDAGRLRRLQADLAGAKPLTIQDVLTADERAFLAAHAGGGAERQYLYSWGLAWYLTFEENLLGRTEVYRVLAEPQQSNPATSFARLVNRPLAKFESTWREAMLALKAGP